MKDEYSDIQRAFSEKAAILLNKKANLNDVELNNAAIDCVFETSNMWENIDVLDLVERIHELVDKIEHWNTNT